MNATPAFVLSGVSSGSGKTTVSLGLMAAFSRRGLQVAPFKCGPDFIDPGLHHFVTGSISRNLDLWMGGEEFSRNSFLRNSAGADIAIVEGVMGMFDGGLSSSGVLSREFALPNILVLDVRSMSESAAAVIKGFETLMDGVTVTGVILNRIASERHLQLVKDAVEKYCNAEILGYLPRTMEFAIPSRHLGLLTGDEAPLSPEALQLLAEKIEKHVNLDRILELCSPAAHPPAVMLSVPAPTCRIAVARDKAFCFYYEDNFDLLRAAGAELLFFSPMEDREMPAADALYLGGGYPELYADTLSENHSMLSSIRSFITAGRPVFAECGGFMYLTEGIEEEEGRFAPLIGHFPVRATMNERRTSLGYRELTTQAESFFGPAGTILHGHEFHYSKISAMPDEIERLFAVNKPGVGELAPEGYRKGSVVGGYMHLHFGSAPAAVETFIAAAVHSS
jgi:cobyrinic acid a,c-diamide synthase